MSHLPRRQPPALAKVRGALRTYRDCERCAGQPFSIDGSADTVTHFRCPACNGTGRILTDSVSATRATRQARTARNDAIENHGRQPYD